METQPALPPEKSGGLPAFCASAAPEQTTPAAMPPSKYLNALFDIGSLPSPMPIGGRSEIGLGRLRHRKQFLMEEYAVVVVLGAHRLQQRIHHLVPRLLHVDRLVESVRVVYRHQRRQLLAVGRDREALDDMFLLSMGRAEIVDVVVLGRQTNGVDHERVFV